MSFVVEVSKKTTVQAKAGKKQNITVKVGVCFADKQLSKKGMFVDSDVLQTAVNKQAEHLASDSWDKLFDFAPTFENVSRWVCEQLKDEVKQLEYVEIDNTTSGVVTQYIP